MSDSSPSRETTPVSRALSEMGIPHRLFRHPGPIHSLEQAAQERGQSPEQVVRSILFRQDADTFVMVLIAGPQQIAWRRLRQHLGQPRLTTASREEVNRITGYQLGAVAPFGLPAPLRILADESIRRPAELSIGSGVRGTTVILRTADLERALGQVEWVSLAQDSAE
jgi:Cys-tRNA(Pro)/Cys-tRNA(Cys) deacylase